MNILTRLTREHLKSNKKRTAVTIVGVALSTALICALTTLFGSFQAFMVNNAIYDNGDFHAAIADVSLTQAQTLTAHEGVESAFWTAQLGTAVLEGSQSPDKPYLSVQGFDAAAMEKGTVHLIEGRLAQREDEIVISEHIRQNAGVQLQVGQTLTLQVGKRIDRQTGAPLAQWTPYQYEQETIADAQTRTYTIVGVMERLGSRLEPFDAPGYTVLTTLDPAAIAPDTSINVYARLTHASQTYDAWPKMLADAGITPGENCEIYNTRVLAYTGTFAMAGEQSMFTMVSFILAILIMVGSISVIYNAFSISTTERKKQFGLLASVGATPKQIRASVRSEGLFIGLIGIPLGIGIGLLGMGITLKVVDGLIGDLFFSGERLTMVISLPMIALAVLLAIVTIAISLILPMRRAARTSPMEAIRASQDIKEGKIKQNRLRKKLFGFEADLALKQLQRSKKRYRITVFSLFVSLVLFITFSGFATFLRTGTSMQFEDIDVDYTIASNEETVEDRTRTLQDVFATLQGDANIQRIWMLSFGYSQAVVPRASLSAQADELLTGNMGTYHMGYDEADLGLRLELYGMDDAAFDTYLAELGLREQADGGIEAVLINDSQMDQWRESGGTRRVKFQWFQHAPTSLILRDYAVMEDEGDGSTYTPEQEIAALRAQDGVEVQLLAVTDQAPFHIPTSEGMATLYLRQSDVDALQRQLELNGSPGILIRTTGESGNAALTQRLEQIEEAFTLQGKDVYAENLLAYKQEIDRMLTVVGIFCYGFVILMMLISITSVLNTITTNMQLRKREFAMLQSMGMSPKSFRKMILFESLFYGCKALMYALPVSVGLLWLLYRAISQSMWFPFTLPWGSIGIAVLGVLAIVFLTMRISTRKLQRESLVEHIRQESV